MVTRYHPLLVALHWITAALVVSALTLGALVMVRISNTDPMKLEALRSHMTGGALILVLVLVRLLVRTQTAHPAAATTGSLALDRVAWVSHRLLYVLVLAQASSGIILALETGLSDVVLLHRGALPADFWVYPMRGVHYVISRVLMALIALHVSGALYHLLIRRDGLLGRMWFGGRVITLLGPRSASNPPSLKVKS